MADEAPPLDDVALAARLEAFRQSGLRIDAQGRFWHQGAVVEHEGLRQALWRWLDRLPDGRTILRLDEKRYVYVDVEDTPLLVQTLRWPQPTGAPILSLSDGREEPLAPERLTIDAEGILRTWVRNGQLEARLSTAAAAALAEHLDLQGDEAVLALPGQPPLRVARRKA